MSSVNATSASVTSSATISISPAANVTAITPTTTAITSLGYIYQYIGCFEDGWIRALSDKVNYFEGNATIELCIDYCAQHGKPSCLFFQNMLLK